MISASPRYSGSTCHPSPNTYPLFLIRDPSSAVFSSLHASPNEEEKDYSTTFFFVPFLSPVQLWVGNFSISLFWFWYLKFYPAVKCLNPGPDCLLSLDLVSVAAMERCTYLPLSLVVQPFQRNRIMHRLLLSDKPPFSSDSHCWNIPQRNVVLRLEQTVVTGKKKNQFQTNNRGAHCVAFLPLVRLASHCFIKSHPQLLK